MSKLSVFIKRSRTLLNLFKIRRWKKTYSWQNPVVICAIARNEEPYLKEWLDYHLNLGFEKIFLYDNNDSEKEPLSRVLGEYIEKGQLQIINAKNKKKYQIKAYLKFCRRFGLSVSWCAFLDVDEFVTLAPQYADIREYLSDVEKKGGASVHLSWKMYGDNGKVYRSEGTVQERFPNPVEKKIPMSNLVKTIARACCVYSFDTPHCALVWGKTCRGDLTSLQNQAQPQIPPTYTHAYIRHYFTKTLQEFLENKLKRGRADIRFEYPDFQERMERFYEVNERSEEKDLFSEKLVSEYFPEYLPQFKEWLQKYTGST